MKYTAQWRVIMTGQRFQPRRTATMTGFRPALFTAFCVVLGAAGAPITAQAEIEYPWCAQYSGDETGGRNCGFVSYEQCMATARGAGANCEVNLFYVDRQAKQKQQPRKRSNNNN
jgi:hypothetical protein